MLGGVEYKAYKAVTVVRGQTYRVAVRKTGSERELGLLPYTRSIFVNGSKGTDVTVPAPGFLQAVPSEMQISIGSDYGFEHCDGAMRYFVVQHRVPNDIVMADTP